MNDIIQEEGLIKCVRWCCRSRKMKAKNWPSDRATWRSRVIYDLCLVRGMGKLVG